MSMFFKLLAKASQERDELLAATSLEHWDSKATNSKKKKKHTQNGVWNSYSGKPEFDWYTENANPHINPGRTDKVPGITDPIQIKSVSYR